MSGCFGHGLHNKWLLCQLPNGHNVGTMSEKFSEKKDAYVEFRGYAGIGSFLSELFEQPLKHRK